MLDSRMYGLAENKRSISLGEIGNSGITISGGRIDFEWNKDLLDFNSRINVYKKMRADGSVGTALDLVEFPIQSQTANMIPASTDSNDIYISDFVQDILLNNTSASTNYSFRDHIQEETQCYQYGVAPFEIVFQKGDYIDRKNQIHKNMTLIKKIAMRFPSSISRWIVDKTDGDSLDGIEQYPSYSDSAAKSQSDVIFIPMDKMLIYVNNKIGNNWEGISTLRPVYKHFKYKEALYKIEAIGLQKNAFGIPVLYLDYPTSERVVEAKKLLRSLQAHEEAGIALNKESEELKVYEGGISTVAIHRAISHHDSKILQNVLAGFMLLGQESRGGARNLGTSLIEFFMMSLDSKIQYSTQIKNKYLIPKIVNANFTNVRKYPIMTSYSGRVTDKLTIAQILETLSGIGLVNSGDIPLKKYVDSVFGFPRADVIKSESEDIPVDEEKTVKEDKKKDELVDHVLKKIIPDIKDENFLSFKEKWDKIMVDVVELERKNLSQQVNMLLSAGQVPNINFMETKYTGVYKKMIEHYLMMAAKYTKQNYDDKTVDYIVNIHENEAKINILKAVMSLAEKSGK